MNSDLFETLPPTKLFFRCAIPSMISMAISALYSVADGIFVGRFIGQDALALAVEYLRVYALFAPITIVFFATDNFLRICGRQNYSMILNVVTSILNIVLDFLFICVLKRSVWSAAFASCISIALGSVLSLIPFICIKTDLRLAKGMISPRQFGRMLANGSSKFFTNIAGSIFSVILNAVLLSLGGTLAVAAVSIVEYAESIVGEVIFGMVTSL